MTDRELLELAAKAAGYTSKWDQPRGSNTGSVRIFDGNRWPMWTPLSDDGEALRLAVKLELSIDAFHTAAVVGYTTQEGEEELYVDALADPYAAVRRAIVMAAAYIGEAMP